MRLTFVKSSLGISVLAAAALFVSLQPAPGQARPVPLTPPASGFSTPVGPGWRLAAVSAGRRTREGIAARRQLLELIGPRGRRHRLLSVRLDNEHPMRSGYFVLADWSADGRTALLWTDRSFAAATARIIDIPTGAERVTPLLRNTIGLQLAADGGLLAATTNNQGRVRLSRLAPDGSPSWSRPTSSGSWSAGTVRRSSPDRHPVRTPDCGSSTRPTAAWSTDWPGAAGPASRCAGGPSGWRWSPASAAAAGSP